MKALVVGLRVLFFAALVAAFAVASLETVAIVTMVGALVALLVLRWVERSRRPQRAAVT